MPFDEDPHECGSLDAHARRDEGKTPWLFRIPALQRRVYSQNGDHSVALATRYIEANLDRHVSWDEARAWLEAQQTNAKGTPVDWLLLAVLDLEWTGAIQYDTTYFR